MSVSVSSTPSHPPPLLKLDISRLPKQAYTMLFDTEEKAKRNKKCWASRDRNILLSIGFGQVWLQQDVLCERAFNSLIKQRLTDI